MSTIKVSSLAAKTSLSGSEEALINDGGTSKKVTVTNLIAGALPKSGGAMTGAITTNSTFDGIDIATRDGVLTSTTTTANAALPKAGGAMTGSTTHADNIKSKWGSSDDLEIFYDGSHSYISDQGPGHLKILVSTLDFVSPDAGETYATFHDNGAANLYYDNVLRYETTTYGGYVSGNLGVSGTVDGIDIAARDGVLTSTTTTANAALPKAGGAMTGDLAFGDNVSAKFGASNDLQISHSGSHSIIKDAGTGNLYLQGSNLYLKNSAGTEDYVCCAENGVVSLYYDNAIKLATASDGVSVTGKLYADGIRMDDNEMIQLGNSYDLQIHHNGGNSFIEDVGTGNLYIRGSAQVNIQDASGNPMVNCVSGAATKIAYNGVYKFDTQSGGCGVTGNLVATGNVTAYSDERLKDDIQVIPNALSKVEGIRGVTFTRNDLETDERFSGVIAQEVEAVLPEVIHEAEGGMKTVDYGNMVGLLIEGMKEQQEIIRSLAARIEELEAR